MKKPRRIRAKFWAVSIVLSLVAFSAPVSARADVQTAEVSDSRVVVTFNSGVSDSAKTDVVDSVDGDVAQNVNAQTVAIEVPDNAAQDSIDQLKTDPRVDSVVPDHKIHLQQTPNDPCVSSCAINLPSGISTQNQWYLSKISAPQGWDISTGSSSVRVAVIDTGISQTHPELSGKVDFAPSSFASDDPGSSYDDNGHGTHVAGVIAASTNDGSAIASVGWQTRLLAVKVLDGNGDGWSSDVAAGVNYAVSAGSKIISMSLGGSDDSTLHTAITNAENAGVLVVAAAGNSGSTTRFYPAGYAGVLSVAATDSSDALASFSNRGTWVDIAAPGVNILSTYYGDASPCTDGVYQVLSGTSMATPMVSAAAALLLAANPSMSASSIITYLENNADHIAASGSSTGVVSGRLNVAAALAATPGGSASATAPTIKRQAQGFWLDATDGGIFSVGTRCFYGSTGGLKLNKPIVGVASIPSQHGYWLVASDGGIFSFGDANFYGSTGGIKLNKPIVGMASTPSGHGYWLVASDGGIFSFGDANFYGSTGGIKLNQPIVGMSSTASGHGYWMVASDGGIFSFGDANFYGSTGGIKLNKPIVGMASTSNSHGYWMVASDGGIFSFGNASFYGSAAGHTSSIVGMQITPSGAGYWITGSDGKIYNYGDASAYSSVTSHYPVVGLAG